MANMIHSSLLIKTIGRDSYTNARVSIYYSLSFQETSSMYMFPSSSMSCPCNYQSSLNEANLHRPFSSPGFLFTLEMLNLFSIEERSLQQSTEPHLWQRSDLLFTLAQCALRERSLFAIGKGCKKLKNLILSDCYFLSDKGLEALPAGCPELAHLEVNGCHNIGTCGLEFVGRSCKQLSELALLYYQKIGNCALTEVGRGCKYLQALDLVDCSSIGDDAIYNIAKGCRNLKKLQIR